MPAASQAPGRVTGQSMLWRRPAVSPGVVGSMIADQRNLWGARETVRASPLMTKRSLISTVAETPHKLDLVTEPHHPEPTVQSPRAQAPRIVAAMDSHRPEPELSLAHIERRTEPVAPGPALAFEGELDLRRGTSKLRALACSPLAIVAVVLIVLIIVTGKVLIARSEALPREEPRRDGVGRCIEHTHRVEVIERMCERDGS